MIAITTMLQSVCANLSIFTGLTAIISNQNGVRPLNAFIEVGFTGFGKIVNDETRSPELIAGVYGAKTLGNRDLILELEVFGGISTNAIQILENIRSYLEVPSTHEAWNIFGLTIYDQGDVVNITWLEEDTYSSRAQMVVYVRSASMSEVIDYASGVIEHVSITGNISENEIVINN